MSGLSPLGEIIAGRIGNGIPNLRTPESQRRAARIIELTNTVPQADPNDPALEAEFQRRLAKPKIRTSSFNDHSGE